MNLHFPHKLAATVFHNTASLPQNREFFSRWLFNKLTGAFCDRASDCPEGPNGPISGTLGELHISCHPKEVEGADQGTYGLTAYQFDWWITETQVDHYGYPVPDTTPRLIMVGGLYNSGTLNDPQWGSHT